MTLQLDLDPKVEELLKAEARKRGVGPAQYAAILIESQLAIEPAAPKPDKSPRRRAGSARGLIHLAADFDAPLDDFAAYH